MGQPQSVGFTRAWSKGKKRSQMGNISRRGDIDLAASARTPSGANQSSGSLHTGPSQGSAPGETPFGKYVPGTAIPTAAAAAGGGANGGSGSGVPGTTPASPSQPLVPGPPRHHIYRGAQGRLYRFQHGVPTFPTATDVTPCYDVVAGSGLSAYGGHVFRLCRSDITSVGEEETVAATRVPASRLHASAVAPRGLSDADLHGSVTNPLAPTATESVKRFDLAEFLTLAADWKQQVIDVSHDDEGPALTGVLGGATRTKVLPVALTATEATDLEVGSGSNARSSSTTEAGASTGYSSLQARAKRGLKKVFRVTEREVTTWAFYNDIPDCAVRISVLFGPASQLTPLGTTRLAKGLEEAKATSSQPSADPAADAEEAKTHPNDEEGPALMDGWASSVVERNRRNPQWVAECVVPPLTTVPFVSGRVKGGYRMRCTVVAAPTPERNENMNGTRAREQPSGASPQATQSMASSAATGTPPPSQQQQQQGLENGVREASAANPSTQPPAAGRGTTTTPAMGAGAPPPARSLPSHPDVASPLRITSSTAPPLPQGPRAVPRATHATPTPSAAPPPLYSNRDSSFTRPADTGGRSLLKHGGGASSPRQPQADAQALPFFPIQPESVSPVAGSGSSTLPVLPLSQYGVLPSSTSGEASHAGHRPLPPPPPPPLAQYASLSRVAPPALPPNGPLPQRNGTTGAAALSFNPQDAGPSGANGPARVNSISMPRLDDVWRGASASSVANRKSGEVTLADPSDASVFVDHGVHGHKAHPSPPSARQAGGASVGAGASTPFSSSHSSPALAHLRGGDGSSFFMSDEDGDCEVLPGNKFVPSAVVRRDRSSSSYYPPPSQQ